MKTVERERPSGVVHAEVRPVVAVVDDDPSVRDGLRSLLASAGYIPRVFGSGRDFLGSPARSEVACLVLDAEMRGLSGLGLQRQLSELKVLVPIIFVTAAAAEVRARALAAGAFAVVGKPCNGELLLRLIGQVARACWRGAPGGDGVASSAAQG
jgi:FixJ family two-component response regulator